MSRHRLLVVATVIVLALGISIGSVAGVPAGEAGPESSTFEADLLDPIEDNVSEADAEVSDTLSGDEDGADSSEEESSAEEDDRLIDSTNETTDTVTDEIDDVTEEEGEEVVNAGDTVEGVVERVGDGDQPNETETFEESITDSSNLLAHTLDLTAYTLENADLNATDGLSDADVSIEGSLKFLEGTLDSTIITLETELRYTTESLTGTFLPDEHTTEETSTGVEHNETLSSIEINQGEKTESTDESASSGLPSGLAPPLESIVPPPSVLVLGSALAGLTMIAGGLSSSIVVPVGRGWLLTGLRRLVGLPRRFLVGILRYSRRDDSDPLANEYRARIFTSITESPGIYLSQVERETKVSISTARHHLRILEEEGLVESGKHRGKRRYYPTGHDQRVLAAALDEAATRTVLRAVARMPGATNAEVADELNLSASTISHHLARLEEDGLIVRTDVGRQTENRLPRSVANSFSDDSSVSTVPSA